MAASDSELETTSPDVIVEVGAGDSIGSGGDHPGVAEPSGTGSGDGLVDVAALTQAVASTVEALDKKNLLNKTTMLVVATGGLVLLFLPVGIVADRGSNWIPWSSYLLTSLLGFGLTFGACAVLFWDTRRRAETNDYATRKAADAADKAADVELLESRSRFNTQRVAHGLPPFDFAETAAGIPGHLGLETEKPTR